jgi:hypothetical protein
LLNICTALIVPPPPSALTVIIFDILTLPTTDKPLYTKQFPFNSTSFVSLFQTTATSAPDVFLLKI